jgi:hypothetical protein
VASVTYIDPAVWVRLGPRIDKRIAMDTVDIAAGGCADYAAYKQKCGFIMALYWVLEEAKHLSDPHEEEET